MNRNDIIKDLQDILSNKLNYSVIINEETQIGSMIGPNCITVSSLEYIDFIVEIEKQYNIVIDFDVDLFNIKDIVDYVISHYNNDSLRIV